jgi:uncharacterized membrane protein
MRKISFLSDRILNSAIIIISILLLIYSCCRAAILSFTIDESISYNLFVPLKFMDIISYAIPSSNHHLLNTIGMKYFSLLFGTSEFVLRLPSLLSHLTYLIFTYRILKKTASPIILLTGFLLLNLNPYLLDFFSLARGYAMAVTFVVVSIYYLLCYIENNRTKTIIWSLIFAMLAVLSNFSLLVYFVSFVAVINIYWIASQIHFNLNDLIRKNTPVFIGFLFLATILFEPLRKLIDYKELYDGGMNGFWSDTVGSLISASLYDIAYSRATSIFINYFIAIFTIIMVLTLIFKAYCIKTKIFTERFTIVILLLILPCFVSIFQHYLVKSNFLINRMALFYIPLFFLSVIFFINDYVKTNRWKILCWPLISIIAGVFSIHTVFSINTSYALYWKFDSKTERMLSDLENQAKQDDIKSVKLGTLWLFEPTINFYRNTKKYSWLEKVTEDNYENGDYDYYYLDNCGLGFINRKNLTIIKHYNISNTYLAK